MKQESNRNISIITGPCSAESREQLHEMGRYCQEQSLHWLRAGIWKPRTRPGKFEGVGDIGLQWLSEVQAMYDIPCMTEVANAAHAEKALKAGLKGVWIGARTTVNPFYVQEIADALKGANIWVFVKNPVNPDFNLWLGAFERLDMAGVSSLAAIHRGFQVYGSSKFRNYPIWSIPIQLKTTAPDLPLFCDVSHICGRRDLLKETAQKALDLNCDGLMIESHPHPGRAKSDAQQQITPRALSDLLAQLVLRDSLETQPSTPLELLSYRQEIDEIDRELLALLAVRKQITTKIGELKKERNISILAPDRWRDIVEEAVELAVTKGLSADFVRSFFSHIHEESIESQVEVMQRSEQKLNPEQK